LIFFRKEFWFILVWKTRKYFFCFSFKAK